MLQGVLQTFPLSFNKLDLNRIFAMLVWVLLIFGVASAQNAHDENVVVIEGVNEGTVFGLGNSIKITGTVKQGAMGLGGDVIVEGVVEGDVATIGGSVIQRAARESGATSLCSVVPTGPTTHLPIATQQQRR